MSIDKDIPILIVDDYKTTLRILRTLLKQLGFENVTEAVSTKDALNLLHKEPYALILSDWYMEPETGYDLLCTVRENPKLSTIPFVMIVKESEPETIEKAISAGVNAHITKPFKAIDLKEVLALSLHG